MNEKLSYLNVIRGVCANQCPRCRVGSVFLGFYSMNALCPHCGFKFEKEPGYFMGAVFAGYIIVFFSLLPTIVFGLLIKELSLSEMIFVGVSQILIMHPLLFRFSKLIWLYLDARAFQILDENVGSIKKP